MNYTLLFNVINLGLLGLFCWGIVRLLRGLRA